MDRTEDAQMMLLISVPVSVPANATLTPRIENNNKKGRHR